jgi:hypothetical protein
MDAIVDVKPTSGHLWLCLTAWRIFTSSGQDREVQQQPNWPERLVELQL